MSCGRAEFARGARAAAAIAADYDKSSLHEYRLGDCILGKMNIRAGKPRVNRYRPANEHEGWIAGFAVALAEMNRLLGGGDSTLVRAAARGSGITTIKQLRAVGVSDFDLRELRKAGVK